MNLEMKIQRDKFKKEVRKLVELSTDIDLSERTRKRENVEARNMFYKLLRIQGNYSYQEIADCLGKNHATVLHGVNQLTDLMENDLILRTRFNTLRAQVEIGLDVDEAAEEKKYIELRIRHRALTAQFNQLAFDNKTLSEKLSKSRSQSKEREAYYQRNGYVLFS